MAQITTTHMMRGGSGGPTVAEIKQFIAGLPEDARLVLAVVESRDQRDGNSWTMTSTQAPGLKINLHPFGGSSTPPGTR